MELSHVQGAVGTEKYMWSCGSISKHRPLCGSVTEKGNVIFGGRKPGMFETRRKGLLLQFPVVTLVVQGRCCHQQLERIEKKDSLNDWTAHPPTGDWGDTWHHLTQRKVTEGFDHSDGQKHKYSEKAEFNPANKGNKTQ